MIRHVVLINLKPDIASDVAATIVDKLRKLPAEIPAIREYDVGIGLNPGNATIGIVALFEDALAFQEYQDHPAHRAVADEDIVPATQRGSSIQFEV